LIFNKHRPFNVSISYENEKIIEKPAKDLEELNNIFKTLRRKFG